VRMAKPILSLLCLSGCVLLGSLSLSAAAGPASEELAHGNFITRLHADAVQRSTAETFLLTLTVDAPIEARLLSIEARESRKDGVRMVRLEPQPPRAIATDRLRHELRFRVYPYLPGELLIADFRAHFQQDSERIEVPFGKLQLSVTSLLGDDPESAELADWVDFPEPEPVTRPDRGAWWIVLVMALFGMVLAGLLLARRRKGIVVKEEESEVSSQ